MAQIPPNFAGYPRQSGPPRIRFDVIGEAWNLFKAEMGTWVLASFVTMAAMAVCIVPLYVYMFTSMLGKLDNQKPDFGQIATFYGLGFGLGLVMQVVQSIARAGMHNMARKQINGEEISMKDFFAIGNLLPSIIGAGILVTLATYLGVCACYVGALIVQGLFMFTFPIIVQERKGAIAAMTQSWDMLKGDMWMALAFSFVVTLLAGVGAMACWIGIIFTLPLWPLSVALVYRDFTTTAYDPSIPVAPYNIMDR